MIAPQRPAGIGWTFLGAAVLAAVLAGAVGLAGATADATPRVGEAIAFAAGVCFFGSVGGWFIARWPTRNPAVAVAQGLGAVALRIFLPLAALGWLQTGGNGLSEAGAGRFVVFFYLALLATDIFLHIMGGRRSTLDSPENFP
ncbi:MAG: hypothetical protein ACKOK8_06225 [Planctomycetia bacterium]